MNVDLLLPSSTYERLFLSPLSAAIIKHKRLEISKSKYNLAYGSEGKEIREANAT